MGKRSAVVELFLGDMGSIQRELRPSTQREDQLTMETKLEQIPVKAVNQLPKSVVREIRTPRSVGTGGGRPPPVTRWARRNPRPYRERSNPSLAPGADPPPGGRAPATPHVAQPNARHGLPMNAARTRGACDAACRWWPTGRWRRPRPRTALNDEEPGLAPGYLFLWFAQ
jgi:hypothetical protein